MNRVLITGATGFIGRHCLPLLSERGYEVHAVSYKRPGKDFPECKWHRVDLLDTRAVWDLVDGVQPSHLLHLAWFVTPGKYLNSIENFRWVQSSLDLLGAFAKKGGQRVVVAGTCLEYDWKYEHCSELDTPLSPRNVYGACKRSLQIMLEAFARESSLSWAWGRIFFVYGPHEHPDRLVASMIRSVLKDSPAVCSNGKQIRDFLYVKDVASAFVSLLGSDFQGTVNIGSGIPVSLKEVVCRIGEKLDRLDLIRIGEGSSSPLDPDILFADVKRLNKEVGWMAKFDIDNGLDQSIEWWKERLDLEQGS